MKRIRIVITCDHPACPAEITAPTQREANTRAQAAGWAQRPDLTGQAGPHDLCPSHWAEPPDGLITFQGDLDAKTAAEIRARWESGEWRKLIHPHPEGDPR